MATKTTPNKTPKFVWTLFTSDTDIKTYQVSRGDTHLGYVDVDYYEGRICGRVAVPKYNDTECPYVNSRKEANEYLWATHLKESAK